MTTSRQRMLDALEYNHPDKIPVIYHASPAGLYVHGRKLMDLLNQYPPDNPVSFDTLPQPKPGTIDDHGRYHEERTDEWGTTWEWLIYGLYGHPRKFPLADLSTARSYVIPRPPSVDDPGFMAAKAHIADEKTRYLSFQGGISLFERMCSLRPMDDLLVDVQLRDPELLAFMDRLMGYWQQMIDYYLRLDVDAIFFADDWGTQTAPIISPKLFREIYKPRYAILMDPIKRAGKRVFFHSCGFLGEIFDDLLDLQIDLFWPQILRYDESVLARKCQEHKVTIYIHPDRQHLIPLGTPQDIDSRIGRYAERYHALGGGGIFYVEIENDAPFENVKALIESVHKYR